MTTTDLLEADWIQTPGPTSVSGPTVAEVPAPLQELAISCDALQGSSTLQNSGLVPTSSAAVGLPEASAIKALQSFSNSGPSGSTVVPHIPTALRAPLGGHGVPASLRPHPAQPDPPPAVCGAPRGQPPPQDDFDEWDVDLEELDESMFQCAGWTQSGSDPGCRPDDVSPAKRMRSFTRGLHSSAPPLSLTTAPRVPTFNSHGNVPPQTLPCGRSVSGKPAALEPVGAPPPGQIKAVTPLLPQRHSACLFQAISPALLAPRPLHTPVLTNHLVQLVSAANKTPHRSRSDAVRTKMRRFPGPAGVLPQQLSGRSLDDIVVTVPQTPTHGAVARVRSEVPSSQVSEEEEFGGGVWAAMKADLGLDEKNQSCFLHSYSIVMVLRKAALRQLAKNKVPNMAVVLKSIVHTHADAKAVFKDPTGEMQGTVHRRLLEDRQGELKTGAVLLLKQVGVFSPSHRNHYLNVTPNNLLRIYPPDGSLHTSQPVLEPAGLLLRDSSRPEGGPVSQMELHFEEEEEGEQTTVPANTTVPVHKVLQPSGPEDPEQTLWDADDLDELIWELPV
ncbi:homologous recombination OB-fold protein isoform X2 [Electrophorus electricus]|uniref:homologous recombination OB-fold protein isoform X2 n=1 Tax=Electrophorus electricus TaxID=8005 RepID=UPI0015CFE750|nr:homologous recombination OB-fold protein isoform X2 [Electrophorus electricus]